MFFKVWDFCPVNSCCLDDLRLPSEKNGDEGYDLPKLTFDLKSCRIYVYIMF